jgi:N-acetylglucosaminyldiphosphoundecaprenol N-acetyl-beta-D-mannosaminyltransferase
MGQPVSQQLPIAPSQSPRASVFKVLGVHVNAVQIPDVIAQMENWIAERTGCHFIAVTGMHGVTEAQHDPGFKQILNSADLVVPDGMPLVWLGRRQGHRLQRRVYGPELMQTFCLATGPKYRHFFYGGIPGVATLVAEVLQNKCGTKVVGNYSPSFRPLSNEEDEEIVSLINAAEPNILWIGLSTPKQERWMYAHRPKLRVPVVVGVGAAFDLNSGRIRQAPTWMREHGLEWSYRLLREPRRLWRRYLVYGSEFLCKVALELLSLRSFD